MPARNVFLGVALLVSILGLVLLLIGYGFIVGRDWTYLELEDAFDALESKRQELELHIAELERAVDTITKSRETFTTFPSQWNPLNEIELGEDDVVSTF